MLVSLARLGTALSDVEEFDLDDPDVEPHTMVDIPIYGLPSTIPDTPTVRIVLGGVDLGDVVNDPETVLAVLFDNAAFRLVGWKLELAKPVEFCPGGWGR
jgi:hypothetical protein